jgi:hypothetical protein
MHRTHSFEQCFQKEWILVSSRKYSPASPFQMKLACNLLFVILRVITVCTPLVDRERKPLTGGCIDKAENVFLPELNCSRPDKTPDCSQ